MVKRRGKVGFAMMILAVSLIMILSLGVVSAGFWGDLINKIAEKLSINKNSAGSGITGEVIRLDECAGLNEKVKNATGKLLAEKKLVVVREGDKIYRNKYFILKSQDGGKLFHLIKVYDDKVGYGQDKIKIKDVVSRITYNPTIESQGNANIYISGEKYQIAYFGINKTSEAYITIDFPQTTSTQTMEFDCKWPEIKIKQAKKNSSSA